MPLKLPKQAKNRNRKGKGFENDIKSVCNAYNIKGIAHIWQCGTRCRFDGERYIPLLSDVDFMGVLNGGRIIAIECKTYEAKKLPIVQNKVKGAGLKQHQIAQLQTIGEYGGLAFVLWRRDGEVRLFNFNEFSHVDKCLLWERGHKVKQGSGFIYYDFLKTVKEL